MEPSSSRRWTVFQLFRSKGAGTSCATRSGRASEAGEHLARLAGVHGHARLAEDVLARFEGGDGEVAVHVGPGADADGVDVGGGEEGGDIGLDAGDAELLGDGATARLAAVADGDQLDLTGLAEAGDVAQLHVAAGADEANAQGGFVRGHRVLPSEIVWFI